jgi:GMP synthase-like glutamine amidotransferase
MKVSVLQHAASEGPGEIARWAGDRGHKVEVRHLYLGEPLPALTDFDLLVVMGGEMNIYQDRDWRWLKGERAFIAAAVAAKKKAIGICLGAQFLADALGGRVTQSGDYEMGWLPVSWTDAARQAFPELPATETVLHWHGDTFSLPAEAVRLASSDVCEQQGFMVPGRVLGLQFHMEADPPLVQQFVQSQGEWPKGRFVQTSEAILAEAPKHCDANRLLLHSLLDWFCAQPLT